MNSLLCRSLTILTLFLTLRPAVTKADAYLRDGRGEDDFLSTARGNPEGVITGFLWDGGGSDNNFSTAANWNPNAVPPNDGNSQLAFSGNTRLTPVVDAAYTLTGLIFDGAAGPFTLSGAALTTANLTQNSPNSETINNQLNVTSIQTWSFANNAGPLIFGNDLIVGNGVAATLVLNKGTVTLTNNGNAFYLGVSGGAGTLNLSGTTNLSSRAVYVGHTGTGTVNHSGGAFTSNGSNLYLAFRNNQTGTYTLSGPSSTLTTGNTFVGYRGTGKFTQSGGTHTTGQLLLANVLVDATTVGTYDLDGGTLHTGSVVTGPVGGSGPSTFNFNGGFLQANANSSIFLQGLTTANVRGGGAKIDSHGFNITVAQPLLHSTIMGDAAADGGLTKSGAGTLTLSGSNTYNGATNISTGTLENLGTIAGNLSVANGATLTGAGKISGTLNVNAGGSVTLSAGTMTVNGGVTNNGLMRFSYGANLLVGNGSVFINNGTLDIISGGFTAPAGFINNGTVLDGSVVKAKQVTRDNTVNPAKVTVTIDSYSGHTYQLQRRDALGSGADFADVGDPQNGTTNQTLSFTDPNASSGKGFYRIRIDS